MPPHYALVERSATTRGDFRSHSEEVVVHAGMDNFHRRLVAGVAVTATHVSAILTVNRDKNREMISVSSKDRKYRADRLAARIVAYIISKEKTKQKVSFAEEQVYNIQDFSMPQTFLSNNIHSSTTLEVLSERWGLRISQDALSIKSTTHKLTRSAIMTLAQRYRAY